MSRAVMSGDLEYVRLGALLHLAETEMLSGRISFEDHGHVEIDRGHPVAAACGDDLGGIDAMRELFFCDRGSFELRLADDIQGDSLGPVIALVMDGCRLVDEWERLATMHLVWDPTWEDGADDALRPLIRRVEGVLGALDGSRSLAQVIAARGRHRSRVTDPLRILLEAGHLEEVEPPEGATDAAASTVTPVPGTVPADGDYDELVARGRELLRGGDLDAAEERFLSALELRPNDRVVAQNLRHVRLRKSGNWSRSTGWRHVQAASERASAS